MPTTETPTYPIKYGKYELLERIGEGGMAEVFRARLPGAAGFEKILVLKRILPHLANKPDFVRMFVDEAKLAAKVQHQNVVQVFELGEAEGGELYMAMEYVPGVDLRRLLVGARDRKLKIPVWFVLHTVSEVLSGLAFAHDLCDAEGAPLHVVHRDVTPGNIFISYQGEVKLADFGIAKAAGRVSETEAGQVKGNAPFMSPEAIYGRTLDARADVFSAGVVLWASLALRLPFEGASNYETAKLVCEARREPPSKYNPAVTPELDAVSMAALEIDRGRRIPSAREFQARLLEILARVRPRLLPADVRHVVDVLLGKRPPDAEFRDPPPRPAEPPPEPKPPEPAAWAQRNPTPDPSARSPQPNLVMGSMPDTPVPPAARGVPVGRPLEFDDPRLTGQPHDRFAMSASDGMLSDLPDEPLDLPHHGDPRGAPPNLVPSHGYRPPDPAPLPTLPGLGIPPFAALGPPMGPPGQMNPLMGGLPPPPKLGGLPELQLPPLPELQLATRPPPGPAPVILSSMPLSSMMDFMPQEAPPAVEVVRDFVRYFNDNNRFFVRFQDGRILSAASLDECVGLIDPQGRSLAVGVSLDQASWMDVPTFARLTGFEALAPDTAPPRNVNLIGQLEDRRLSSVLAQLSRQRATGRLTVISKQTNRVARREIDVLNGAPVHVFTDHPTLQLPHLCVQHKLLNKELTADLVVQAMRTSRPLEELAKHKSFIDLATYRPAFMRDRLAEMFTMRSGRFAFDAGQKVRSNQPFSASLLRILPDAVLRAFEADQLLQVLDLQANAKLRRGENFDIALADLAPKDKLLQVAKRLGQRLTISQVAKKFPAEAKETLAMAMILIDLDALVP